jgi:hypothetical protein
MRRAILATVAGCKRRDLLLQLHKSVHTSLPSVRAVAVGCLEVMVSALIHAHLDVCSKLLVDAPAKTSVANKRCRVGSNVSSIVHAGRHSTAEYHRENNSFVGQVHFALSQE